MKRIKHLSLLLAAALITVSIYAQTGPSKPPQKGGLIQNQKPLKMPPPTKLPVATKPAQPAADTKAMPPGRQAQPVKPAGK